MNFDFARPFQFVFEDRDWLKKVLLAGVYMLLPILGVMVLMGYQRRIILQVAEGNDTPCPELDQFGDDLAYGFKMFVVSLCYTLPGLIFFFGGGLMMGITQEIARSSGTGGAEAAGVPFMLAAYCLGMPLMVLGGLLAPIGILRMIDTGEMAAAFRPMEVFNFVKENGMNVVLSILVGVVGQFIAQFGIVLFCIGALFTAAWAMMIQGHAYGQVLRLARAKGGSLAPNVA